MHHVGCVTGCVVNDENLSIFLRWSCFSPDNSTVYVVCKSQFISFYVAVLDLEQYQKLDLLFFISDCVRTMQFCLEQSIERMRITMSLTSEAFSPQTVKPKTVNICSAKLLCSFHHMFAKQSLYDNSSERVCRYI